jgi:hypothetical protein
MKRSSRILVGVTVLCILAGPALAWYPSTAPVELGTATW